MLPPVHFRDSFIQYIAPSPSNATPPVAHITLAASADCAALNVAAAMNEPSDMISVFESGTIEPNHVKMKEGSEEENDDGMLPPTGLVSGFGARWLSHSVRYGSTTLHAKCNKCNEEHLIIENYRYYPYEATTVLKKGVYDTIVHDQEDYIHICALCIYTYNTRDRFLEAQRFRRYWCLMAELREDSESMLAWLPRELVHMIATCMITPLWNPRNYIEDVD